MDRLIGTVYSCNVTIDAANKIRSIHESHRAFNTRTIDTDSDTKVSTCIAHIKPNLLIFCVYTTRKECKGICFEVFIPKKKFMQPLFPSPSFLRKHTLTFHAFGICKWFK